MIDRDQDLPVNRQTMFSMVLVLCAAATAQTTYLTSPSGFDSKEGSLVAYYFGAFANGRNMHFDAEMRGKAMSLREVAYRMDYRVHGSSTGAGRSWTNVTLEVADCDVNRLSNVFTANLTTTPSRVFSALVAWPTVTGMPPTKPAAWGGLTGKLRFPFTAPWQYAGKSDICLDFQFTGGSLANAAPWSNNAVGYALDSYDGEDHSFGEQTQYGYHPTAGCWDSQAKAGPGTAAIEAITFGPEYKVTALRNKHEINMTTWNTAHLGAVVHAVSLGGYPNGTVFPGLTCNKVFLDPTKPTVYFMLKATGWDAYNKVVMAYNPNFVGTELWIQGAWNDWLYRSLKLTNAMKTIIPPIAGKVYKFSLHNPESPLQRSGIGPHIDSLFNPLVRYGK